ncbi:hypothetical protein J7L29_00280 [Candidatus Bathyarchaeota archaeon]|nr:hypothetical protein [Candidatus Bathyarchaeota archaeon]
MRRLAKIYLIFFGVYHLSHILSLLGLYEFMTAAPYFLSFWEWHLILLLVYGIIPIIAVLINHPVLLVFVTLTCLVGFFIEVFKVFEWITDGYYLLASLDLLASLSSSILIKAKRVDSSRKLHVT